MTASESIGSHVVSWTLTRKEGEESKANLIMILYSSDGNFLLIRSSSVLSVRTVETVGRCER